MTNALEWYRYEPRSGVYDETVDSRGQVRDAWSSVARLVSGIGSQGLRQRLERCNHLLAAHGATHVPHRELLARSGPSTGWHLDPLPFVIGREEWAVLSGTIAERARMLSSIASDLSGERRLVRDGVIPNTAIYSDPSFLPTAPADRGNPIVWYGADLVRTADGHWRVLRDYTDVVRGVGEALLHRSVLTRALGDLGDRNTPTPLTGHLADFRSVLAKAALAGVESPRTVVLTPDTMSLEYLATSYLCAQLGFHRTSAADLVVRDHRVYLRSLGGREPVDVVLRALRAADLDPLANPLSSGGVPGLVAAERAGLAAVVNPVSAALVGSPSLAPHLQAAMKMLLGADASLPMVPASWCGDREVLKAVLAAPEDWVLQDVSSGESVFGYVLHAEKEASAERRTWTMRLRLRAVSIVARRVVEFSTVPVVRDGHAVPGSVVLGVSALVDGSDVRVMPGGFARVIDPTSPILSQHSGWAKDVWVYEQPSQRPVVRASGLPQVDLRTSLPTRAAEAMFWLGRAAEGAEVRARTIRTIGERAAADQTLLTLDAGRWRAAAGRMLHSAGGPSSTADSTLTDELDLAVRGRRGLLEQIDALLLAASTVREFLSTTTGRVLADVSELRRTLRFDDAEVLEQLLVALAAFTGLTQESTVRGPGWRLLDLGRRIERALGVLGAVEATLADTLPSASLQPVGEMLLAGHESLVAYRRWHRTDVELDAALDLLVRDDTNPRSVAFQLDRIGEHLASLPSTPRAAQLLADASSALFDPVSVAGLVIAIRGPLLALAEELADHWFSDRIGAHRLGEVER